uniref:Uncharacterized protein n=1 Tax=Romanomermis culicivorax TaxID=13658 RepID=A0A915IH72_ROMCU
MKNLTVCGVVSLFIATMLFAESVQEKFTVHISWHKNIKILVYGRGRPEFFTGSAYVQTRQEHFLYSSVHCCVCENILKTVSKRILEETKDRERSVNKKEGIKNK